METLIKNVLNNLDQDSIADPQFRWKYLKYEKENFSFIFQKILREIRKLKECTWKIN